MSGCRLRGRRLLPSPLLTLIDLGVDDLLLAFTYKAGRLYRGKSAGLAIWRGALVHFLDGGRVLTLSPLAWSSSVMVENLAEELLRIARSRRRLPMGPARRSSPVFRGQLAMAWPLASAVASQAAGQFLIFASDCSASRRISRRPAARRVDLNSSCLACATSSVRVGFGRDGLDHTVRGGDE